MKNTDIFCFISACHQGQRRNVTMVGITRHPEIDFGSKLSRVSSLKGQVLLIHHLTPYEGTFEKAQMTKMNSLSTNKFINPEVALDFMLELQDMCHIACYSQCDNPTIFQYALMQVKDKLLEDCFLLHSWMFFCS